jgi:hypothetical protein
LKSGPVIRAAAPRTQAERKGRRRATPESVSSAKTASVHVSNILAKLGVSGRVEAAARRGIITVTG